MRFCLLIVELRDKKSPSTMTLDNKQSMTSAEGLTKDPKNVYSDYVMKI